MYNYLHDRFEEAKRKKDLKAMENLYRIEPNDPIIKFEYAKLLVDKNEDNSEAEKVLLDLLKYGNEKEKNMAIIQLGRLEAKRNNLGASKKYFLNSLCSKNQKDIIMSLFYLGKIAELERDYEEAEACFKEIVEDINLTNEDKFLSKLELAYIKILKEEYDEARQIYNELKQNGCEKEKSVALFELSNLYKIEGKYDEAIEELKQLLRSDNQKDFLKACHTLAKLYAYLENYNKAERYLKKLLRLGSEQDKVYAYRLLVIMEIKKLNTKKSFEYIINARERKIKIDFKEIFYVVKDLNIGFKNEKMIPDEVKYVESQILDYDPYVAVDVILEKSMEPQSRSFNDNIDVYKLFNDVKPYLIPEYKINDLVLNDRYVVPYYNVGINGENYLFIETIPNTKDIIKMFPINSYNEMIIEENTRKRI